MSQGFLLLDASCGPCSSVGRQIEEEGLLDGSGVQLGSLHNTHLRSRVDAIRPDAKWEPTLIWNHGDSEAVYTGLRLAVELTARLGVRRAHRISQIVREATKEEIKDPSRRTFLVKLASAAAVVPLMGVGEFVASQKVRAKEGEVQPSDRSPAAGETLPSEDLTAGEVLQAYKFLAKSPEFKKAHRAARRDGLKHRVEYSEPTYASDASGAGLGFYTENYGATLLAEDATSRLLTFYLKYAYGSGHKEDRWITAIVDVRSEEVVSLVDVDASEIDPERTVTISSSGDDGVAGTRGTKGSAAVPGQGQTAPAGKLRFSNGGSMDVALRDGVWSGLPPAATTGLTRQSGVNCGLACGLTAVLTCARTCLLIAAILGPVGGWICTLVCGVTSVYICYEVCG